MCLFVLTSLMLVVCFFSITKEAQDCKVEYKAQVFFFNDLDDRIAGFSLEKGKENYRLGPE